MVEFTDYYTVLGIGENASLAEIKLKYRQLAKTYHPDRSKSSDAKFKMQSINEAYSILSNSKTKTLYDAERLKYYAPKNEPTNSNQQSYKTDQNNYQYSNEELNEWILRAKKNAENNKVPPDPSIGYLSIFGFFLAIVLIIVANLNQLGAGVGTICIILLIFTCVKCFATLDGIFRKLVKHPIYLWLIMVVISVSPSTLLYFVLTDTENYHKSGPIVILSIFFTLPCLVFTVLSVSEPISRRY